MLWIKCHLLNIQYCCDAVCVLMEDLTCLQLPTLPHHLPYPLPCAIRAITVAVRKVAQNPAVLAS